MIPPDTLYLLLENIVGYIVHRPSSTSIKRLSSLHIPPPSHTQSLPTNITHVRTDNRQDGSRGLSRGAWSAKWDILKSTLAILPSSFLLLRNPQRNLNPIRSSHKRSLLLRSRKSRSNMSERDCVSSHTERRAPFFSDSFRQADDACFGEGVVCLAGFAV